MSENTSPNEPNNEAASALSAPPAVSTTATPGLWGRLSTTQKLCALVSGSVVTLVGGIGGYNKFIAKPTAPAIPAVVAQKPDTQEPPKADEKDPAFQEPPPVLPPVIRTGTPRLPDTPDVPPTRVKIDDVPTLPVVGDRPKVPDPFKAPKLPDIPDVPPTIVPPKELPADLHNKTDVKATPILRVGGVDETAPPPKKVDIDPLKLDIPAPPTPPAKVDVPVITPPKPMGMTMDPPLLLPTPPSPAPMGMKKDDLLIAPPAPPTPMDMGKKDDLILMPPTPPQPPTPMGMGVKKDDLLLTPPPPPLPMGMGMKKDDLILTPPLPMPMPPLPMPMKKDDLLVTPPTPPSPLNMGVGMPPKKDDPAITIPMPPGMIDLPMIDPKTPARKETPPLTIDPVVQPKRDNYEEDWHTPKPSDTFATISREYYKSADYSAALEAYNKNYRNGDRIIRVPPTWVLKEKFPDLVKDTSIDPKVPERLEKPSVDPKPGLKFDNVEPPVIGSGGAGSRPAPPPAVAPVNSRMDEYRVNNPSGESIKEIARKVFGNADQWKRLYDLNPSVDPTELIPVGTVLRLSK